MKKNTNNIKITLVSKELIKKKQGNNITINYYIIFSENHHKYIYI